MLLQEIMEYQPELKKVLEGMPRDIKERCRLKTYKSNSTIIKKGEDIKYVNILCKGELNVINEFANGSIYILNTNKAIDYIGEMEVLAGETKAVVTNIAKTDCIVFRILKNDFIKWTKCDNYITHMLAKRLAVRLCYTSCYQGYSHYYPAIHMIKRFIIEYVKNEINDNNIVYVNKKRQEIADILGISVKTVGRNITKLKAIGLVTIKKGKIYVDRKQYKDMIDTLEIW
ncbi:Crp/Fnr family transcriptional regulator [Vallitalea sp.]|jgi:CRP/FNR family cyclic AMP-dependent transcriptional regulator|uniref:Crp/Fnr family transcriptional regulator n=1 Tax=Vallitalea sp. TaxID=1882829 RepID=UPI0025F17FC0|nr:Crp/Fnr family transcriptional regulator [Vallitalea sp.]MCT4688566.1 Crp/Fnr family transcriptional regulator [Vallitalea sp.]